jgi:hypothetical protein
MEDCAPDQVAIDVYDDLNAVFFSTDGLMPLDDGGVAVR